MSSYERLKKRTFNLEVIKQMQNEISLAIHCCQGNVIFIISVFQDIGLAIEVGRGTAKL